MAFDRHFAHSLEYGVPTAAHGFSEVEASPAELEIVDRLTTSYHRALKDDPQPAIKKQDIWSNVRATHHIEILDLLQRKDIRGTASYLRDAPAKGLTYGIAQAKEVTELLRTGRGTQAFSGCNIG